MSKIKVLIVDDSALMRRMLGDILSSDAGLEVVGAAADPYDARELIKRLNPDVLTLDVEMPKMDGISFLRNVMRLRPMPVLMVSSLTEQGADVTLQALELGAIDFVTKPKIDVAHALADYADEIIEKVKTAARVKVNALTPRNGSSATIEALALGSSALAGGKHFKTTDRIIAIGASTGGTEAIKEVLTRMPPDSPGTVITQHIPAAFSGPFAIRMDSVSPMTVCEASDGQQILPGHVYIAPGDRHLTVVRDGARYRCRLDDGEPVNRHRPAVDVMFRSVAGNVGRNALGVLLTGMGADGAEGLKEMRQTGAHTIAQDEKTSIVWGMPGEAVKRDAVDVVLPLPHIAQALVERSRA